MGGGLSVDSSIPVDTQITSWIKYYQDPDLRANAPLKEDVTAALIERGLVIIKALDAVEPLTNHHVEFLDHFVTEVHDYIRVYATDEYQLAIKIKAVRALRDTRIFLIRKTKISPSNLTYIRISNRIDNIIADESAKIANRSNHNQNQNQDQLYAQALALFKKAIHDAKNGEGHDPANETRRNAIGSFERFIGGVSSFCHKSKLMSALILIIVIGLLIVFANAIDPHKYIGAGIFLVYAGVAGLATSITFENF